MNYRKIFRMLVVVALMFVCSMALSSCGEKTCEDDVTQEKCQTIIKTLDNCRLEDASFVYDGTEQSLTVQNLPEGATVTYENNGKVNVGNYDVKAKVSVYGTEKELTAQLSITRAKGVITADANQTIAITPEGVRPYVELNNDEQILMYSPTKPIGKVGTYTVTVTADLSKNYAKPDPVVVTVKVVDNLYGLKFESQDFVADGSSKSLAVTGDLPSGTEVVYTNNDQKLAGKYQVKADLKNTSTGEILHSFRAIMNIDNPRNEDFADYMDELLVMLFEGDQFSVNFFFNNAASFGIPHYDAELSVVTFDDFEEGVAEVEAELAKLHAFKDVVLSEEQRESYEIVERYFDYLLSITEPMSYMTNGFLGSYLGAQANLPLELSEYKFRNEQDVKDFISYLESAPTAFKSYFEFTKKQAEFGFAMPDFVIDNVVSQCKEFVEIEGEHYLVNIFNKKIDETNFLTAEKIADYKKQAETSVKGSLTDAYRYIQDNLPSLKGKAVNVGGLANYTDGKEYYIIELQDVVGYSDLDGDEVVKYVSEKLRECSEATDAVLSKWNSWKQNSKEYKDFYGAAVDGVPNFSNLGPVDLLTLFKDKAASFVPDLAEMPDISVKYVDESLKENFSPACYFVSPLDETNKESIYLNPKYTSDYNYVFTTLAHEGYPGHLYQNVYAKSLDISNVRKILRCSGYMEGWATYMEMNSYSFVTNYESDGLQLALNYLALNDVYNGLISARADLGVHYEGWTIKQFSDWMAKDINDGYKEGGLYYQEAVDFYNQVVEIPTNAMQYYYSYCKLDDMHDLAQEKMGIFFDEVAFNKIILDCGAAPLEMVEEAVNEYIDDMEFIFLNK